MSAGPANAFSGSEAGTLHIASSAVVLGTVRLGEGSLLAQGAVVRSHSTGVEVGTGSAVLENSVVVGNPRIPTTIGRRSGFGHRGLVIGVGYASLGVLRDIPADLVKIDGSFIAALERSEREHAIVEHAIALAHDLGLVVIAEGIETNTQRAMLRALGCDQGQGYALGRPAPVDDLAAHI